MAKFTGPSVLPGAQLELPIDGQVSDFAEILATPIPTQEPAVVPEGAPTAIPTQPIIEAGGGAPMAVEGAPMEMPTALPGAPVAGPSLAEQVAPGAAAIPAVVNAPESLAAEQRERERVPSLTEVLKITSLSPASFKKGMPLQVALERAENTSNVLNNDLAASLTMAEGQTIAEFPESTLSRTDKATGELIKPTVPLTRDSNVSLTAKGVFFDPRVLDAGKYNEQTGRTGVDPEFAKIMSLTTEAYLHNQMYDNEESENAVDSGLVDATEPEIPGVPTTRIAKAKGRERLGREVYQGWKRMQAQSQGRPTDEYLKDIDAINPDTFTFIGDLAKETYARANPDILVRDDSEVGAAGGQVYFQLTAEGAMELDRVNESYKGLFAQPEVPPLTAPSEAGQPVNEARTRVRPITTKVGDMKDMTTLNQSIRNYNKVAYVNDPARENVTMLVGLLGLLNANVATNQSYSDMLGVGDKALAEARNEKKRLSNAANRAFTPEQRQELLRKANLYDPVKIVQAEREKTVNILAGLARYSGKKNHLTFSIQGLTGRTHAQQTIYNPQAHKVIRGAVGGGNVFKWEAGKGGALEAAWKETIATRLFKKEGFAKTAELSEAERIKLFNENQQGNTGVYVQAVAWGNELLNASKNFDVDAAKEIIVRLRNSNTPEEARAIKLEMQQRFSNDPLSANLKAELASHGKEFGFFAGYYMELAKYDKAIRSNAPDGKQFASTITVEMDGKTHGPATNAALLGIPEMAKRGGLIRTQDLTATDEIDLRIAMKDYMQSNVAEQAGALYSAEHAAEYSEILNLAVQDKENFLKKSPMTMGYGQELQSLKMHVDTTVFTGPNGDQIRAIGDTIKATPDEIIDFLHAMLVDSIFNVLDAKVVAAGRLLKANAFYSILTNEVLYFDNAMGFRSYAAGKQMVPELTEQTSFSFRPEEGQSKGKKVSVQLYRERAEGSAVRPELGPGGYTTGRIQPVAVQSYDGNMISRTGSDASWKTITDNVPQGADPFVLPIFDAYVVDLGTLASVRQEANRHWYNGIANHSYTNEIFTNWYQQTSQEVKKKLLGYGNSELDVDWKAAGEGQGPFRGLAFQFLPAKGSDHLNLRQSFKRTMQFRAKKPGESVKDYTKFIGAVATKVTKGVLKQIADADIDLSSDKLTNREVFIIINIITNANGLSTRNASASKMIEADKKDMLAMVRKEPRNVDL
tara:strand:+ start:5168 stop:8776 length:3609 start_codon:yes stop_codon:yes gene_type:complete